MNAAVHRTIRARTPTKVIPLCWAFVVMGITCCQVILSGCANDFPRCENSTKYRRVAVLPFESPERAGKWVFFALLVGERCNPEASKTAADDLSRELLSTGLFRIVERRQVAAVLDEMKMSVPDLMNPENMKRFGKLLSADAVILGTVHDPDTHFFVFPMDFATSHYSARLVDVESLEVIWHKSAKVMRFVMFPVPPVFEPGEPCARRLALEIAKEYAVQ